MMENTRRDWTSWLHQQRRFVLNIIFTFILLLGFIGISVSIYAAITTKILSFNLIYYCVSYLVLLIMYLIHNVPDLWRSLGLLLLLYVFGLLSLYSGWLAGGGRIFLLALIVMAAVLIHPRAGLIAAVVCLVTYAVYGLAYNQHWLTLRQLPNPTTSTPIILEGVGFAMVIAMVSLGLWYFGKALMAADQANREAQEARAQLDEHARKLVEANELVARQAKASLQESETKFRDIIQQASDAIILSDEKGIITYWNKSTEKITGIKSEDAIGNTLWKMQSEILVDGRSKKRNPVHLQKLLLQGLKTGKSIVLNRLMEGEILSSDGTRRYYQQLAFPIKTRKGFMIGTIIRDITEKRQIEIEREDLITKLEIKNAELERFTYTVSHDLKSPLITIQGFLGYIEKDALSGNRDRFTEDIQRINNAVNKMQHLLNELLDLSRVGRLMSPPEDIPFEDIVQEAINLTEGRLKEHNARVSVASNLPIVRGDRTRLVEAIQNLIDNAAKFMGDQPQPLIQIGARDHKNQKIFFVQDNGVGIDPQYQEKIFGLFNKLDPKSEGSGVGLSLVKRIIEVHNGSIWVESEGTGKGTAVCFTLEVISEEPDNQKRKK